MSSLALDTDVLERLGLLKARSVTPLVSDVNVGALEVGFVTQSEPGVVPDTKVLVGIIPGTTEIHSARILDVHRNPLASWHRHSPEDQPPEWVFRIAPACLAVNLLPKKWSDRRTIRRWINDYRTYVRSHPDN